MNITVAAALKKIAVALLSKRKVAKKVGIFILSITVAIFMPMGAVLALFEGKIEFSDEQISAIADTIDAEELAKLAKVQLTLDEIEEAMDDADVGDRYEEAEVLYILVLYKYQDEDDFVDRLVGCFEDDPSDRKLIKAINKEFGCDIDRKEYSKVIKGMKSSTISAFGYEDPYTKNNQDLVKWAWEAYDDGWGYVWGTYGQVLTQNSLDSLAEAYPNNVDNHYDYIKDTWLGRRTADCAGLIKGYLWFNPDTHQIEYGSNGFDDNDADSMYNNSTVNGTIDTLPDMPGLCLWKEGHVGIYVGDGYVIHASTTKSGVIKSEVKNTSFTNWFEVQGVNYPEIEDANQSTESE